MNSSTLDLEARPAVDVGGNVFVSPVDEFLKEQQSLSAVELFARQFEGTSERPLQADHYTALMPTRPPGVGEQYAFDVDLDLCSGCKACVTACHSLNGLDDGEAWRDVGLLLGTQSAHPVMQHITTACHHCLDPACANACPVNAYEKNPVTGIVRHLDDQCFGCQYCTLACPYDVPKYHNDLGIVRKCDLCSDRLAADEAPACVQACPHAAIQVTLVETALIEEAAANGEFLTGCPSPDYTRPTTQYRSTRLEELATAQAADALAVTPEHPHRALVAMLVLTQISVGCSIAARFAGGRLLAPLVIASWLSCLLGLAASTSHLGRPQYAFRALIGLRHSWLSREILAFSIYAGCLTLCTLNFFAERFLQQGLMTPGQLTLAMWATCFSGAAGIVCSAMIYHVVRRHYWRLNRSLPLFFLTATICATAFVTTTAVAIRLTDTAITFWSPLILVTALTFKLAWEVRDLRFSEIRGSSDSQTLAAHKTSKLLRETLWRTTAFRGIAGIAGGLTLILASIPGDAWLLKTLFACSGCLLLVAGEFAERDLFFTAVVRQKMPGGITQ